MLAEHAARVRETVRKTIRLRVEEQARRLGTVGAQHNGFRLLHDLLLAFVEVRHASDASRSVRLDLAHVTVRAKLALAAGDRLRHHRPVCARLGAPLARKGETEAAVMTGLASFVLARQNRHRRGLRTPAEFLRADFEQYAGASGVQRRQREWLRAHRLTRIGAGIA